jgi:type III pantothenate kinase
MFLPWPAFYSKIVVRTLCIDIGNTLVKAGLFEHERMLQFWKLDDLSELTTQLDSEEVDRLIVADVRKLGSTFLQNQFRNKLIELSYRTPLPFQVKYSTPATLGVDRIALVAGAQSRFPNQHVLVLDAGTCLTYDFLDAAGQYHGGAISPGLKMRFRALHEFTAALPHLNWNGGEVKLIGNSTQESIFSGIVLGTRHEVLQTVVSYAQQFENLKVLVTGGDINLFEGLIKNDIFAVPNLLLEGLNQIAIYNENFLS